ncbi:MAG: discoidin domain-containing protein [Clostridia bacterium]|nr:discoidin domain-containing protein [Clostridia bacterium]
MIERIKLSANQNWTFYRGAAPAQSVGAGASRRNISVWDVDYDDSAWERATLPHTEREEALMCSGGRNYQGEAWYRRRFTLPQACEGKVITFELEAAMQRVDAWLDGEPLGVCEGGFLPMAFDLTGLETGVEHVLTLRVDNSDMPDVPPGKPQGALDFCYFGGIYRDAWLHAVNPVHITSAVHAGRVAGGGLYVRYGAVSAAEAEVRVDVHLVNRSQEGCSVSVQILLDGEAVYAGEAESLPAGGERVEKAAFTVNNPRLWHPHHPNLYALTARLAVNGEPIDEVIERIGIRTIEFRPEGFFINGEKLFLDGANRHQEYAYAGFAIPDSLQRRDVRLLREAGIISVRTAHYPQDQAFMDACDELGVLCVIPTPGWQIHPDSVLFDERSYENTRRLIRMNRNHPSACLWEPILNETDYPGYFAKKQLEIVREELGPEAAWAACDSHYAYADHYPVIYDRRHRPGRSRYIREYGDNWTEQFGPMKTLRRVRRGEGVSFYSGGERAMIRSAQEHFEEYAMHRMDGTLTGAAMWAGIDHNRGYENSEAAVGMLDLVRLPKFCYYLMMAQQDMAHAGPVCFVANDWTEDSPRDVAVYTNAPAARLWLNGRLIASLTADEGWSGAHVYTEALIGQELPDAVHPPIVFKDVPWEKGELRAEALDGDNVVASYEVRTPGAPKRLRLAPQWAGEEMWVADGADLLMVHAFVEDENGTTVKSAEPSVRFSIEGDAEIVGDGLPWVGANPMKAEAGAAGALLRAGCGAGRVVLTAEADGLEPARLELNASENPLPQLPGRACGVERRLVYPVDANEFFSERQSLKQESWFRYDLGRDKPCAASSSKAGTEPGNVNHGMIREPWIAADRQLPQWWRVDLQEQARVSGLTVRWYNDGLWYDYAVETSPDGEEWTQAAEGRASGQSDLPVRFAEAVTARYVRVVVNGVTGDEAAGIYLVEVYGDRMEGSSFEP